MSQIPPSPSPWPAGYSEKKITVSITINGHPISHSRFVPPHVIENNEALMQCIKHMKEHLILEATAGLEPAVTIEDWSIMHIERMVAPFRPDVIPAGTDVRIGWER